MNIILFGKCPSQPINIRLSPVSFYTSIVALFLIFSGGIGYLGYWAGGSSIFNNTVDTRMVLQWQGTLNDQQLTLVENKKNAQAYIDALSQRLGKLQAHIYRLDALGGRLTQMAKMDKGEFNFEMSPPLGGPENTLEYPSTSSRDIIAEMNVLDDQLQDREQQLNILASMMMYGELQQETLPTGRPVIKGWMSSFYGERTDPFTGKRSFHKGVDFAGKIGSDIISVAAGVVTWAGDRYGFGKMVEIDHGNGYSTRYAHNSRNMVKLGDKISRGQLIAKMGSSGRSTGSHVHFEVVRNGKVIDPMKHMVSAK